MDGQTLVKLAQQVEPRRPLSVNTGKTRSDEMMCRAVARKKAQESTVHTTVRRGRKSGTRTQRSWEMGAQGQNVGGGLEVAKRDHVAPTERRQFEEHPFVGPQVGIGKAQKLEHVS